MNTEEQIIFDQEKHYQYGGVIYDVFSYFDENAEKLNYKIKRLLKNEINSAFRGVI